MQALIEVPEELASRLKPLGDRIPHIIELGLRKYSVMEQGAFEDADEIMEFLAGLPEPEEVMKLRPSEKLRERIVQLLEKNRESGLSEKEETEWEQYRFLEHMVRIAKAKAFMKINSGNR